jgi:myo-inositol-1(or 4)-monophosphatase
VFSGRGIFSGFWEQFLKPWDTAAGVLIVAEAGGRISDFYGRPFQIDKTQILATNGLIHQEMLEILAGRDIPDKLYCENRIRD